MPWLVYSYASMSARGKNEFGNGDVRGVIASGASTNAIVGGSLLPTIALGIPGSAPMALLLGALLLQGVVPGPDMLSGSLDLTYMMVWVIVLWPRAARVSRCFSPASARWRGRWA